MKLNNKTRITKHLTLNQAHALIAAASHAFCIDRPLSVMITVHFNQAGITRPHAFITAFFKLAGDWLRAKSKESPYYVWVLENAPNKGLHLHALIHVPYALLQKFTETAERWVEKLGSNYRLNATKRKYVDNFKRRQRLFDQKGSGWVAKWADETWHYLGWWGHQNNRHGLKGALGYMLKGLDKCSCDYLGIEHVDEGLVTGKRCGFSESLGRAAKRKLEPTLRRPVPNHPKVMICGPELRRKQWLYFAGFLPVTDYAAVKATDDDSGQDD